MKEKVFLDSNIWLYAFLKQSKEKRENYDVTDFNRDVFINASDLRDNNDFSFWDSLIVSSALKKKCTILYSEDMQHNQIVNKKLKIINPFTDLLRKN